MSVLKSFEFNRLQFFFKIDCQFPFQYKGEWYDTCTAVDNVLITNSNNYWCSIDSSYSNRWAKCETMCPQLAILLTQTDNGQVHTSCQPRGSTFTKSLAPTHRERMEILDVHNSARRKVFPSPALMPSVTWNHKVARIAQSRADQCIFDHDCVGCRRLLNFHSYHIGQNAFIQSGGSFNWTAALNNFLNQKQYYNYGSSNEQGILCI